MSRKNVEDILMRRDGMTRNEAMQSVDNCISEMDEAITSGDFDLVEDILASDLCLEMDYIIDLMI